MNQIERCDDVFGIYQKRRSMENPHLTFETFEKFLVKNCSYGNAMI